MLVNTVPSPNGLVMNKAETVLYVGVTRGNAVWRLPLMEDGTASKVGLFIQMSGGHAGPDGMALDEEGGLVIAHPVRRPGASMLWAGRRTTSTAATTYSAPTSRSQVPISMWWFPAAARRSPPAPS